MTRIRLLPLLLIAITALLAVKLLDFATGAGSFSVGPTVATAEEGGGHGEAAPAAGETSAPLSEPMMVLTQPVDLAREAEQLRAAEAAAGAHGESGGHGEAAPAEGHGEAAPAAAEGHGEAAPAADAAHGEAAPAADAGHGEAAPKTDPASSEAAAAEGAGHGEAAPSGHGEAAGGHGAAASGPVAYTQRPPEYLPPAGSSETAILEALGKRRVDLDKREQDLDLRTKLLQAAEQRLDQRLAELKSIQQQLGGVDAAESKKADDEQVKSLVALYENMKPKAAALVFDKLDIRLLDHIARAMNPRKLSPILAAMSPDKAGLLTIAMAGEQGDRKIVVQTEEAPMGLMPVFSELNKGQPAGPAAPGAAGADLPQIMPAPQAAAPAQ